MAEGPDVTIRLNRFSEVRGKIPGAMRTCITALALKIQQSAKYNIVNVDAVDTGAMLNSIYVSVHGGEDGRDLAIGAATAAGQTIGKHSGRPHEKTPTADEGDALKPYEGKVASAVEYAIYIEGSLQVEGGDGGTASKQGRPFLHPAAEEVKGQAQALVDEVFAKVFKIL